MVSSLLSAAPSASILDQRSKTANRKSVVPVIVLLSMKYWQLPAHFDDVVDETEVDL
jgi:hypothetical protein